MRFIALSCLSSAVLAILDMNQLMALKNQASDSTMQSANRFVFLFFILFLKISGANSIDAWNALQFSKRKIRQKDVSYIINYKLSVSSLFHPLFLFN